MSKKKLSHEHKLRPVLGLLSYDEGYSTVFLCLVFLCLVGAFSLCYSAIAKIGAVNEQLRQSKIASEVILSHYHDQLEADYGLLAYEGQMKNIDEIMSKRFSTKWKVIPTETLFSLNVFQEQGVELGKVAILTQEIEKIGLTAQPVNERNQNQLDAQNLKTQLNDSAKMEENQDIPLETRNRAKTLVNRIKNNTKPTWLIQDSGEIELQVFQEQPSFKSHSANPLNVIERGLLTAYLMETFNDYVQWQVRPDSRRRVENLCFEGGEIEFILCGQREGKLNQIQVCAEIFAVREAGNLLFLVTNGEKRKEVETYSLLISSVFPLAEPLVQAGVTALWASVESAFEVNRLLEGKKVPMIKTAGSDWYTDLERENNTLVSIESSSEEEASKGMDYRDFLKVMLMAQNDQKTAERTMKLIDFNLKKMGAAIENWSQMITAHRVVVSGVLGKESSFEDGYLLKKEKGKSQR